MTDTSFINILIAEDNHVSRQMMTSILRKYDFRIFEAEDGDEAINIVKEKEIDLAIVDINMAPTGGFEFVRYLVVNGIDCPVVVVTADDSSDLLVEATSLGVVRVLQKPIMPKKLSETALHILKRRGYQVEHMGVQSHSSHYSGEDLMRRVISMAEKNYKSGKGGPYGAIVANAEGKILGEGVNGNLSRSDPTAHAEVMAIRHATEKLESSDLSDCILYVSSEPTMMGKALIISVGIKQVYYGLSHDEIKTIRTAEEQVRQGLKDAAENSPRYERLQSEEAMDMFQNWIKDSHNGGAQSQNNS